MSKMPAKKKSCFQITSVTQAQVAAVGGPDDTESLEDPDESRTEDVSSEIYDVSRAEYEPVCDRSSSEEALNNIAEAEVIGGMAPSNLTQTGLSSNAVGEFRKVGVSGSTQQPPGPGVSPGLPLIPQPGVMQQPPPAASVSVNASQLAAVPSAAPTPATSTVSCTSRFRVIKLDHGTGEPFRRGRWTCTEFYEKDSEGSVVSRTVDSIRHANAPLDAAADRDSGIGLTGGSVALAAHSGQGLGSTAETSSLSSTRMHSVETLPPPQQQQIHHQNYSARQQGVSGSATHSTFSNIKPAAAPVQTLVGSLQPPVTQNVLPVGQNGLSQSSVHIQKSPNMPPPTQPMAFPPQQQQQVPVSHHLASQSSGLMQNQTEYYQKQSTPMSTGVAAGQTLPVSSHPVVQQSVGQGPTSIMLPASGGASVPSQAGDSTGAAAGSASISHPAPAFLQQQNAVIGGAGGSVLVGGSSLQSQYATAGQPQPHGQPASSGVQNVPAFTVSSSVPTTVPSASSAAMPNVTSSSLPPGQTSHSKTPVVLGVQGLPGTGFGLIEGDVGRKSDGLINAQSPVVSGKEPGKPLMPESLQLTTPTVNSLFGIHIPVDVEGDRNPSKAFYQAFQSDSRLRDSKAHSDSASGTNVVAIDNKIEQAMDLVKSHLMYAVREEVEVLKEQIKELFERNSVLEKENAVLKSLANSEQLSQLSSQPASSSSASTPPQQQQGLSQPPQPQQPQHLPKPQQLHTQPQPDPGQQQQQQQQQLQPNVTSA